VRHERRIVEKWFFFEFERAGLFDLSRRMRGPLYLLLQEQESRNRYKTCRYTFLCSSVKLGSGKGCT
jgi:hypothetical protein